MDEIQKYYTRTVLDPLIGRLIRFLKKAGYYKDCIFILVSEHGFTKINKHIPDKTLDRSLSKAFILPYWETSNRQAEAVIMLGPAPRRFI